MVEKEKEVFGEDFNILDGLGDPDEFLGSSTPTPSNDDDEELGDEGNPSDDSDEDNHDDTQQEESDEDKGDESGDDDAEEDNQEDATSEKKDSNASSPLTPYAKYLKEEGILPDLNIDEFDGTTTALKQAMFDQIMQGVEEYKSMLPQEIHTLIDNFEAGVPLDTLIQIGSDTIKYNSITDEQLEDVDFQKQIYTEYLSKTTRYSKEKIQREVNRLADLQELEDEAKGAVQELLLLQKEEERVAVEQAKQAAAEAEKNRAELLSTLQKEIESTDELIPGNKIPKNIKDKVYKALITPVGQDAAGNPLTKFGVYRNSNPMKTDILLGYLFEVTNEFKDWSVFGKSTKKNVISDIEAAARSLDENGAKRTSSEQKRKSGSTKSFLDALENMNF